MPQGVRHSKRFGNHCFSRAFGYFSRAFWILAGKPAEDQFIQVLSIWHNIGIYAFGRWFYHKWLALHPRYTFYQLVLSLEMKPMTLVFLARIDHLKPAKACFNSFLKQTCSTGKIQSLCCATLEFSSAVLSLSNQKLHLSYSKTEGKTQSNTRNPKPNMWTWLLRNSIFTL